MSEQKGTNLTWHEGSVSRQEREQLLGQKGVTIWMTGLSASGKSTIACILEQMLLHKKHPAYRLDGDNIRMGLNKNLGFSADDRAENIRRIGEVAKLFTDAGVIAVTSFISPYRKDRDAVRASLKPGEFIEVYIHVSLAEAERRDPKGLYKKARAGQLKGFTGIDDPYEAPEKAEILIETEKAKPEEAAAQILKYLEDKGLLRNLIDRELFFMSQNFVDLHCHSTASDGTLSPADVVRRAASLSLSALALTDHDTIAGVIEAAEEARRAGIDFLPGIEISAEYPHPGTMHLLGYGIDPQSSVLLDLTTTLLAGRDNRNPKIIAKLNELGVHITMEEVENEAGGNVIGRPHIAAILMRKGYVSSIKQAFDKYLAPGGLAYFDKERLSPQRALEMILESGGIPVLAHPIQLRCQNDAQLERVVKDLVDLGLAGIEVIHSDHDETLIRKYTELADRYRLLKTGGSDFHGSNKKDIDLGIARGHRIPREFFDALISRLGDARPKVQANVK